MWRKFLAAVRNLVRFAIVGIPRDLRRLVENLKIQKQKFTEPPFFIDLGGGVLLCSNLDRPLGKLPRLTGKDKGKFSLSMP